MIRRILAFIEKEFIQSLRDFRTLFIILIIPALMLVLYAYAVTYDIKNIAVGVLNQDGGKLSIELVEKFGNSEYFKIQHYYSLDDLTTSLNRNKVKIAVIIPNKFSRDLINNKKTEIFTIIDGSDSNTARLAMNYFFAVYQDFLKANLPIEELKKINFKKQILYNKEMKSLNFTIPGLIAILLMVIAVELPAVSIVKEKEQGTIETLYTTPISNFAILVGKVLPFSIVGLVDAILVFLVATLWFEIPFRGSFMLFLGTTSIFLLTCLSLGIFISTLTDTEQGAMTIAFLTSMLPAIILSGFIFPIENMPEVLQYVTYLVPARYFIIILRDLFLKGNGVSAYLTEIISLLIFAVLFLFGAWVRMKKRLD